MASQTVQVSVVFAVCVVTLVCSQDLGPPETVKELDVQRYLGRWYQTHASPIVMETFEKDAVCVTADYGVYNASVLTVYNANRIKTPDGELNDINGYAYTTREPGQLEVDLSGIGTIPKAPYWIIKLGPKTFGEKGLYEYSIVTDPWRVGLFVLTRDVERFRANYETFVLNYLRENGFDSRLNNPIKTYHENDCQYAPKPKY